MHRIPEEENLGWTVPIPKGLVTFRDTRAVLKTRVKVMKRDVRRCMESIKTGSFSLNRAGNSLAVEQTSAAREGVRGPRIQKTKMHLYVNHLG